MTNNFFTAEEVITEKVELKIIKKNNFQNIITKIKENIIGEKDLKITAKTIDGKYETFSLDNILIPLKEYNYDEITQKYFTNLDVNNINSCDFINTNLFKLLNDNEN